MTVEYTGARQPRRFNFIALAASLVINALIAATASAFTIPKISGWYKLLDKPFFSPPNWLFGPVWTVLYVMIAVAAYLVWQRRDDSSFYNATCKVYFVQLFLNFFWSAVFFGMQQVLGALVVIFLLLASIGILIGCFSKFSKTAAWLLLPYFLWVGFASMLNMYIYFLNG